MEIVLSDEQQAICDAIEANRQHICVNAYAGTGKTFTIKQAYGKIRQIVDGEILLCAFNVAIKKELENQIPGPDDKLTYHGLGWRYINARFGRNMEKNDDKSHDILVHFAPDDVDAYSAVIQLVSKVKNTLTEPTNANLGELLDEYDIELECESEKVFSLTRLVLKHSVPTGNFCYFDFDDMLWLPNVMKLAPRKKYSMIFMDEAQDVNKAQMELIIKALAPNGKVVFVGDKHQAIYAFRGADSSAMATMGDMLKERTGVEVIQLGLTKTRRCPKTVVQFANQFVPDFKALDEAPEGTVATIDLKDMEPKIGDMVLCRNNAPLVGVFFYLMRQNIPAKIMGRKDGENLEKLIKKLKAKTIDALIQALKGYKARETDILNKRYGDKPSKLNDRLRALDDKVETLIFLASEEKTIAGLLARINSLFANIDKQNASNIVLLSTVHKAKGLESKNVFWLQLPKEYPGEQEQNIKYVACTRAKDNLVLVAP